MKYQTLGETGLNVSVVGLGTWQLGGEWGIDYTPEMVATIKQYYDKVLIHGDPDLVPFDHTFPLAGDIADWLIYTGYIVDPQPEDAMGSGLGQGEVIVSAGGGALSEPLLTAAIAARAKTRLKDATWRLLAGPSLSDEGFARLQKLAVKGVIVERARADFTVLLANCTLSISQGGYNTVMDVLAAKVRAVIAPYAGGKETEQTLRASLLRDRGALQVVWEEELSPDRLASAVEAALDGPRPDAASINSACGRRAKRGTKPLSCGPIAKLPAHRRRA